ncbi:response regulator [Alkalinema sp. FACHB-956]|uniref:hybrid sensor histidine kinase/response regulator n=1 Tax=Alkalinema sp. FACHB-956 TaxID=2692768 RepID=UPI0016850138|nr:response regulator [Alkalinema sp. FACHB-956]MBD2330050.1 response regulator [Alkalinema sp. FACHB-956]
MSSPSVPVADILVVDDTPDNIRFLSALLTEQGFSVRKALNGPMALTAARSLPPDLILLDITMPDMDGFEVCQQLKQDPATAAIPIIFLSALDSTADKVKAFEVGGVDYITKPFQFAEVMARIQTQLTICHLNQQLKVQNGSLQEALTHLKQTQAQLIQREKMVGLGQLVAGIAHEVNNPINFIAANLKPAQEYVEDLLKVIQAYQAAYPTPSPDVEATIAEADLEFLVPDLQKLLSSMHNGAERIRSIVLACRIFSRLDESEIKTIDLHEGIDSTLLLLQHRLAQENGPAIEVVKQYGPLPPVTCYARQMNQVFLNLLNNAIDALEQKVASHPDLNFHPRIAIQTRLDTPNTITIRIADNGLGIPEEAKTTLFHPFFTTKAVGQGLGLGLSVAHEIVVEKHHGSLTHHSRSQTDSSSGIENNFGIESNLGIENNFGIESNLVTEFVITIPTHLP